MKCKAAGIMILVMFSVTRVDAQNLGLVVGIGGASSGMEDMKYYQEQLLSLWPVELGIISSFPPYTMASAGVLRQISPMFRIGVGYDYTSTGARANYTDYSGRVSTDILAQSHCLGIFASYAFLSGERYDLSVFGKVDLNMTLVDVTHSWYVLGFGDRGSFDYISFSPAGSAGLEFMFHLKGYSLGVGGRYLGDLKGDLRERKNDRPLNDPNQSDRVLTTDWTGWRAQAKAVIWLER